MTSAMRTIALALLVGTLGCRASSPAAPPASAKDQATAAPEDDFAHEAKQLISDFQRGLQRALLAAIKEGGPARAITVCSEQAPAIAAKQQHPRLTLRRIGTRVRNAETNRPTPDEEGILSRLTREQPTRVVQREGRRTLYRAIFVKGPICLKCHGAPETFDPAVQSALREHYPDDEATGYAIGDLRGAFVVDESP